MLDNYFLYFLVFLILRLLLLHEINALSIDEYPIEYTWLPTIPASFSVYIGQELMNLFKFISLRVEFKNYALSYIGDIINFFFLFNFVQSQIPLICFVYICHL